MWEYFSGSIRVCYIILKHYRIIDCIERKNIYRDIFVCYCCLYEK